METFLFLLLFIFFLVCLVLIRTKSNGKYEVKITDVVICLVPTLIWLIITNQISEFGVGELNVKLREVYKKPITEQISSLIDGEDLLRVGVDCNHGDDEDIISIEKFPSYIPFKFILIDENCEDDKFGNSDPTFWGILEVADYKQIFLSPNSKANGELFIDWVKSKNSKSLAAKIPSFISLDNAINFKTSKLLALEQMEKLKTNYLPVIDDKNKFIGIIYRDRVNSSFLIDVGHTLD